MPEVKAREAKLIQYLNEAYGTEKRLETALNAHIQLATRAPYKKRLQQHLTETKRHAREVSKRIKELGGTAEEVTTPGPDAIAGVAQTVVSAGQRAAALAQGPLHALRGTGAAEKQLKNAKTEFQSEAEEIATYTGIEALAEALNDTQTARLARAIRREEERMAAFLEKEIRRLTSAVVREEVPASERRASGGRRRTTRRTASRATGTTRRSTTRASASRAGTTRKTSSRSAGASSRGSRSSGSSSRSRAAGSRGRSSSARSSSRSSSRS